MESYRPSSGKLEVVTNTAEIEEVGSHKLLGLIIDEDLTYEVHADELCNKLSKRLGLLRHISPYLKKNQKIIYFNAVIKPRMMRATSVWTSSNKMLLREFSECKTGATHYPECPSH